MKKINSSPSVKLSFSADTIIFDTVFTTIGSITKEISVYNKESEKKLSSLLLILPEVTIRDILLMLTGGYRVHTSTMSKLGLMTVFLFLPE